MSAGDWFLPVGDTQGWELFEFSFWHCLCISLRDAVFGSVGRPVGKTAASIPRAATQTPVYIMELELVWFGNFKIQF